MTTAIIGTGGIGSAIARLLGGGGEAIRLSGRDTDSARALAADIGPSAAVAAGNADALRGVDAVILALRFTVLQSVIEEVGALLTDKVVIVPSNPLTTDAQGKVVRVLAEGESSGAVVSAWLPTGRASSWRSEPCRPRSWSLRADGRPSPPCSSTRPTTWTPGRWPSG